MIEDERLDALIRDASGGGSDDLAEGVLRELRSPRPRRSVVSGPGMALAGFVLLLVATPVLVAFAPGAPEDAAIWALATGDAGIMGLGR